MREEVYDDQVVPRFRSTIYQAKKRLAFRVCGQKGRTRDVKVLFLCRRGGRGGVLRKATTLHLPCSWGQLCQFPNAHNLFFSRTYCRPPLSPSLSLERYVCVGDGGGWSLTAIIGWTKCFLFFNFFVLYYFIFILLPGMTWVLGPTG